MNKETSNIRISDIAEMAGVSAGTVDRVLHNRGRVSAENEQKVRAVLDRVDYQPNLLARSLASKKQHHIVAIIPSYKKGEYWEAISEGIDKAAEEAETYNVSITKLYFNQYDSRTFEDLTERLAYEEIDGAVVATLFTGPVIYLSNLLDKQNIPYIYIDSNIPGERQLAYFGTESYDAGQIAAKLLTSWLNPQSDILIGKMLQSGRNSTVQGLNRSRGFHDYLSKAGFTGQLHELELRIDDPSHNTSRLDEFLKMYPRIEGAVIFNSTCYILGNYLKERGKKDIKLVGYDVIEKNALLMSEGIITALIAQRPELQGYNSIKSLSNYLIMKRLPEKVNLMPIDILIRENLPYYINNKLLF